DRVLVLGHDEEAEPTSRAVNQVLFRRLCQYLLAPPFRSDVETWLILDELSVAEFPAKMLMRVADRGRSLGVRMVVASQGVEGLFHVYGEQIAREILGQCVNQAVMRVVSPATARYAADLFGQVEFLEEHRSRHIGADGSTSTTIAEQSVVRDAVLAGEFQ